MHDANALITGLAAFAGIVSLVGSVPVAVIFGGRIANRNRKAQS